MTYLAFLRIDPRFLAFGFLITFFASFGQTFFIALFSAELREAFGLSHGGFGTVYSLATLTSAGLMVWAGRMIDHCDLRLYASVICAGMALACLVIANVPTTSLAFLYVAILLLRFTGQGLMSHAAATAMARYFEATRGRALALSSLGATVGEAVLPIVTVAAIAALGWRTTYGLYGAVFAVGLVPLMLWLLRGHGLRHDAFLRRLEDDDEERPPRRHWTRAEVLRDPFFFLVMPLMLANSFIVTGLFFHQVHLAESKGWPLEHLAAAFGVYAATVLIALALVGPLVDRFGAARLLPLVKLPMAAGLLVLASQDAPVVAFFYMGLLGLTSGAFGVFNGAFWAEAYGLRHFGAIRALVSALMVMGSAGSPAIMGWLIDAGVSLEQIALLCIGYLALGTALIPLARRHRPGLSAGAG